MRVFGDVSKYLPSFDPAFSATHCCSIFHGKCSLLILKRMKSYDHSKFGNIFILSSSPTEVMWMWDVEIYLLHLQYHLAIIRLMRLESIEYEFIAGLHSFFFVLRTQRHWLGLKMKERALIMLSFSVLLSVAVEYIVLFYNVFIVLFSF